ncbi:uncharacterized protein LOC142616051 [Castanea sativa]|uniref:uncharacterized protein LOC142616051 n=1 Tax=Castanea sativa TaxID=21020 RepID=UPI003F65343F
MVAALLDEVTGEWKADLVKRVFLPDEAQAILSIPRSNKQANDCMVWAYTPKGVFTVNSAYKVALATSPSASTVGVYDTPAKETFWRTLWSLGISNKIKTFAWRACRNILPTKVNLFQQGVLESATCKACGMAKETSGHLFWECTKAHEVLTATGIPLDTHGIYYRDFIDFIWYLIFVQHAGLFPNLKAVGIGVIIRDHEGSVIAALSKHLPLQLGPLEAEGKPMDEAVLFPWDVGIREAIFETDSSVVSDAIAGSTTPPVSIVDITAGTLLRLRDFRRTQIQHVRRQAN